MPRERVGALARWAAADGQFAGAKITTLSPC
jgi:hypothetical protein